MTEVLKTCNSLSFGRIAIILSGNDIVYDIVLANIITVVLEHCNITEVFEVPLTMFVML